MTEGNFVFCEENNSQTKVIPHKCSRNNNMYMFMLLQYHVNTYTCIQVTFINQSSLSFVLFHTFTFKVNNFSHILNLGNLKNLNQWCLRSK